MYSNDYDNGALMNSYIKWSKRLAKLHQRTLRIYQETRNMQRYDEANEEADGIGCSKCRGMDGETDENATAFPHIQDLCPADRRRIAQLVKQLIKCTKEMQDAKSELAVSESEKEAMRNQYERSMDRREMNSKKLEFELSQARAEFVELKARVANQGSQFVELTETVRDLARQKTRLREQLTESRAETELLRVELQRTRRELERESVRNRVDVVHRGCQTGDDGMSKDSQVEFNQPPYSSCSKALRIKEKEDLDQVTTEGTLIRDLFFRTPSVEDFGILDIIPVLSNAEF